MRKPTGKPDFLKTPGQRHPGMVPPDHANQLANPGKGQRRSSYGGACYVSWETTRLDLQGGPCNFIRPEGENGANSLWALRLHSTCCHPTG